MDASVAEEAIERAGHALIGAALAPATVILFGSRAVGTADEQSDFDFLVIEREVSDRFAEMARLGRLLGRMLVPADVVVVSERDARKWGPVKGTLVNDALSRGRVLKRGSSRNCWSARRRATKRRSRAGARSPGRVGGSVVLLVSARVL